MAINNVTGLQGNHTQRTVDGSQVQVARNEPTKTQQQTGRPSTVDTVSLTDTASRLRSLENTIANLPVVDTQRVQDIQKSIADGTFEVNPQRIADKMFGFESELSR